LLFSLHDSVFSLYKLAAPVNQNLLKYCEVKDKGGLLLLYQ